MNMELLKKTFQKALGLFFIMTVLCGFLYTAFVTGIGNIMFPNQAKGSMIEVEGKNYGSEMLAQNFSDEAHMWGRIMNISTNTFQDKDGNYIMYAGPSNLSPESDELETIVEERIELLLKTNPGDKNAKIPIDLVTCSGSGLDPDISSAAANYQVPRIAQKNGMTEKEVREIIQKCTTKKIAGLFGEETVNVLKVNLMLEGILDKSE